MGAAAAFASAGRATIALAEAQRPLDSPPKKLCGNNVESLDKKSTIF
jgi:hypothetical protein